MKSNPQKNDNRDGFKPSNNLDKFSALHTGSNKGNGTGIDGIFKMEDCVHEHNITDGAIDLDDRFSFTPVGKRMSLANFHHRTPDSINLGIPDCFLVQVPVIGNVKVRNCGREIVTGNSTGAVISPNSRMEMTFCEESARVVARIERSALEQHLGNLIGRDVMEPVRFKLKLDTNAYQPFGVSDTILRLMRQLDEQGPIAPLAAPCIEELLMSLLLTYQPNNYINQPDEGRVNAAKPYYVKRAEEFLQENASSPIAMKDLVRITGVSTRSLYAGFHNVHNMSPMKYLKSVRLDYVREQLLKSKPSLTTVTSIASSWGFVHLGNFALDYRKKFNEKPSETLRRSS